MTKITIWEKGNRITRIRSKGHADYGQEGEDIVCSAISAILTTTANGLTEIVGFSDRIVRVDDGFLEINIPSGFSEMEKQAELLLRTLELGLTEIQRSYPGYVSMHRINDSIKETKPC